MKCREQRRISQPDRAAPRTTKNGAGQVVPGLEPPECEGSPRRRSLTVEGDGRHTGEMTGRHAAAIPLALIAAAGAVLRVAAAFLRRPWHDEYFTVWVTSLPWEKLLPSLAQDSGPPLPYALAKLLTLPEVGSLAAARGLAVAAGTMAVLVAARAAERTAGPRAACWAAALLAFHPLAVAWSCEARAYAYLLLGAALVWNGLAGLMNHQGGTGSVTVGAIIAVWSHGLGLVLVALLVIASVLLPKDVRRRSLAAALLATASFLPWLPVMLGQPPASLAWMERAWHSLPRWRTFLAPLEFLAPGSRFGTALDLPSVPVPIAMIAAAAALGLAAAALRQPRRSDLLCLFLVVVPAFALTILAQFSLPVFYPGRGEALYLAPAVGLLSSGATRGRLFKLLAALLAVVGGLTSGLALTAWQTTPPRPEEHLARAVSTHLPGGATVLVEGYWRLGIWYHLGEIRSQFALQTFPATADSHPGWYEGGAATAEAEQARHWLTAEVEHGRPVACVLPPRQSESVLRRAAAAAGLAPAARLPSAELWIRRGFSP